MDTDRLAANSTFTLVSRVAMVIASTIGLPFAGWLLLRVVASADDISSKVGQYGTEIKLLQQKVDYGFDSNKADLQAIKGQVSDHESRIRVIERDRGTITR